MWRSCFLVLLACGSASDVDSGVDSSADSAIDSEFDSPADSATDAATDAATDSDDACGMLSSLDDCARVGVAYAECGGDGEAVFACGDEDIDSCRWFSGGCVPPGHIVSSCSAADFCCFDDSPFEELERNPYPIGNFLSSFTTPVDGDSDLTITTTAATASEPPELTVDCSRLPTRTTPCVRPSLTIVEDVTTRAVQLYGFPDATSGSSGWGLVIEVEQVPSTTGARVCKLRFSDIEHAMCAPPNPNCANAGTLEVTATGELHGTLDAQFDDIDISVVF